MKAIRIVTPLIVLLLILFSIACSQQSNGKSSGKNLCPPSEAYQACEGKSAGDASQFVDPYGVTVRGICEELYGKLILQPDNPEGKSGSKRVDPPPEAYKACEGKGVGDASQFVNPRGDTVSGICKERDGKLILRPDRPEGKSGGKSFNPPPEAYKACEGKRVGDASQFVNQRGDTVKGICEERDGKLILRPDRPKADH